MKLFFFPASGNTQRAEQAVRLHAESKHAPTPGARLDAASDAQTALQELALHVGQRRAVLFIRKALITLDHLVNPTPPRPIDPDAIWRDS